MPQFPRPSLPATIALACALGLAAIAVTLPSPAYSHGEATAEHLRKCPLFWNTFPDAPRAGIVVDGRLVEEGDAAFRRYFQAGMNGPGVEHEWGRVHEVRLMCAEQLYAATGIRLRTHALVFHTTEGPVPAMQRFLSELAERQEAHFERHGRFAGTAAELGWSDGKLSFPLILSLTEGALGWTGVTEVEGYPSTCAAYGGDAGPIAYRWPAATPLCPFTRREGAG